ncbi:MAG: type II toxin-antitoxin system RelE/ParE family toxin [Nitrospirota bacterium]|jgi:phage-related protein
MADQVAKPLLFIGSSRKDLQKFPQAVRDDVGYDLYTVQLGRTPASAKPLKGLGGVMELVERYDKDTYRAVYIANLGDTIYVLHCFKKKSKRGIATPKEEMEVIRQRLRYAQALSQGEHRP